MATFRPARFVSLQSAGFKPLVAEPWLEADDVAMSAAVRLHKHGQARAPSRASTDQAATRSNASPRSNRDLRRRTRLPSRLSLLRRRRFW